jgi:hypothetical protein
LVGCILDNTVAQGDVPEQVVERALQFSSYLDSLRIRRHSRPNPADQATVKSVILAGALPTFPPGAPTMSAFFADVEDARQ